MTNLFNALEGNVVPEEIERVTEFKLTEEEAKTIREIKNEARIQIQKADEEKATNLKKLTELIDNDPEAKKLQAIQRTPNH